MSIFVLHNNLPAYKVPVRFESDKVHDCYEYDEWFVDSHGDDAVIVCKGCDKEESMDKEDLAIHYGVNI